MSTQTVLPAEQEIIYPDSDGLPMADNTLQFEWIVTIKCGVEAVYRDDPDVFVAGDLLWYPVEGNNEIRTAPDVMVAFGRPKGYRGSYKQWAEGGIPPQVTFEVLSPGNRPPDIVRKFCFYERYGVEEYYLFDPHKGDLSGWRREAGKLVEIPEMNGWVSPRLGVRFDTSTGDLQLFGPDGRKFATYVELVDQWEGERRERQAAERQRESAEREREAAERERAEAQQRAERLAAQLREHGIEPEE
jgi:Uma2 family endonuclease